MLINYLIVFTIGLAAGWIANICIYRIPRREPVCCPVSRCEECGEQLGFTDLIPLAGYIRFKGRCRYCGRVIPLRYPVVEVITALLFTILFWRFGWSVEFAAFSYLTVILVVMIFIDAKHRIIPNGIVLAGLIGGAAVFVYNLFFGYDYYGGSSWWEPLVGIVPGTFFLFVVLVAGLVIYRSDEVMGMGDIKIFAPIGMFLGWKMCIVALLLSLVAGGLVGIVLIMTGLKKRKDTIPFGPFIAAGTFATVILGWDILYWYLGK